MGLEDFGSPYWMPVPTPPKPHEHDWAHIWMPEQANPKYTCSCGAVFYWDGIQAALTAAYEARQGRDDEKTTLD